MRLLSGVLAMTVLLAGSAAALTREGPPARRKPAAYRIAGTVVNGETGEPVERAAVTLLDPESSLAVASTESDANGRFRLEELAAGKYQLSASKRGYRTGFYDEHEEYNSAIVTGPDQDPTHLVFRLTPGAMILGTVTGDGGDAVEGAHVLLVERKHDHARSSGPAERIVQAGSTSTDDTGAYEFTGLEPGNYSVVVQADPWYAIHPNQKQIGSGQQKELPLDVTYPLTFYDSATEEAAAARIQVAKGERAEASILLHAVPAIRIQVPRMLQRNGQPSHVELSMKAFGIDLQTQGMALGGQESTGTIEFNALAPGHYKMTQGNPPRVMEFEAGGSLDLDSAQAASEAAVNGTLTGLGAPLPEEVTVALAPVYVASGAVPLINGATKGRFSFPGVPAGDWELQVMANGQVLPVTAIAIGPRTHAGAGLTVESKPLEIQATVATGVTRIEGFVRKGAKGFAGAMVVLAPREAGALHSLARRDQSDSDGSFALRDVPPGDYTLIALEDAWEMDWGLKGALDRYLSHGVSVRIGADPGKLVRLETPVPVQPR